MRVTTVFLLLCLLAGNYTFSQAQTKTLFPLSQELPVSEFLEFESSKQAAIEYSNPEIIATLTEDVYPYASRYQLEQPIFGKRREGTMNFSFQAYYTSDDSVVKFISYQIDPDKPSFEEILQPLIEQGKTSQEEISRALEEARNDPELFQKVEAIFQQVRKELTTHLGQPRHIEDEEGITLHNRLFWEDQNLHLLLAYAGLDQKKSGVTVNLYWK
jgi:hypothetical protein